MNCFIFVSFFFFNYWSRVDLKCCVSFVQQSEAVYIYIYTYIYIYIHSFLDYFPRRSLHSIYSLDFPVIYSRSLLIINFLYSSVYISLSLLISFLPLSPGSHKFVLYTYDCFCFANKLTCAFSLSALLHSVLHSRSIHVAADSIIVFFLIALG